MLWRGLTLCQQRSLNAKTALVSLYMKTHSVIESLVDDEVFGVSLPPSADTGQSSGADVSLSADVDVLEFEVESFSVAFPSPGPVDIFVRTTGNLFGGDGTAAVGPMDVGVQTEYRLCLLQNHAKLCVPCKFYGCLVFANFPSFDENGCFFWLLWVPGSCRRSFPRLSWIYFNFHMS